MCALPAPPKVKSNNVTNWLYWLISVHLKITQILVMLYITWILVDIVLTFGSRCIFYETPRKAVEVFYEERNVFLGRPDIGCSFYGLHCLINNVCAMEPRLYEIPVVDSTEYKFILIVVILQTLLAPYKICKTLICAYVLCFCVHFYLYTFEMGTWIVMHSPSVDSKFIDGSIICGLMILHFFLLK